MINLAYFILKLNSRKIKLVYFEILVTKTFVNRCFRVGKHDFANKKGQRPAGKPISALSINVSLG